MSKSFFSAAVAVAALAFASMPASLLAGEPAAKDKVSPAAAKTLVSAQEAFTAKRYADAISRAKEALAIPGKTPYDAYVAYRLLTFSYQGQSNKAEMLNSFQGMLDSGYPQPAEQNQIIKNMTGIAYELKNYPQVVEYGNRLIRNGAADDGMYGLIGHSIFLQGKYAEASKFLGDRVTQQVHSGQVPREPTLTTLRASQEKQGDNAGVTDTLEAGCLLSEAGLLEPADLFPDQGSQADGPPDIADIPAEDGHGHTEALPGLRRHGGNSCRRRHAGRGAEGDRTGSGGKGMHGQVR